MTSLIPITLAAADVDCRPQPDEYFEYYQTYIGLVPDGQCLSLMESQIEQLRRFFAAVTEQQASVAHPPYTWTLKQVVGHMIDAERIFAERLHHMKIVEQRLAIKGIG